ncbi:MAG: polysaccharide pyruvyl transferase family protein [Syntrophomonadaceae bacterium]
MSALGDQYLTEERARRYIIKQFPRNNIVSFPQTIYFSPTDYGRRELSKSRKVYGKNKNLTLIARERVSYKIMQKEFPTTNVLLTPDIVFYLNQVKADRKRQGILCCLRSDLEGVINWEQKLALLTSLKRLYPDLTATDTVLGREIDSDNREKDLHKIWDAFREAKVVVTDRLHGMIFAAITATPCLVLSNYNHKVQSSFRWLQGLDYIRFVNEYDQETVLQQVHDLSLLDSRQLPVCNLSEEFKAILKL